MMAKSWNIRDQTEKDLAELLEKKYKEIENDYKILRKISEMEKPIDSDSLSVLDS